MQFTANSQITAISADRSP